MNRNKLISFLALAVLALISTFFAQSDSEPKSTSTKSNELGDYDVQMKNDRLKQHLAETDYYMLALSWSPAFCQNQKRSHNGKVPPQLAYQCGGENQFGWVIHGLWPQNAHAQGVEDHPRYCQGDLPKVDESTIRQYLPESPGAVLLQGEWEKHGACAFNQADAYFAKQKALFQSLTLPDEAMSKSELFNWVRRHNPQLNGIFLGGGKEELYICYNKQWQPMDCPK